MEELFFGRRYRATEKIGTGGMADVYKAVDETLGRTVAVKVMHPRYAADPAFAHRFRQEAQAAANLVSPNIVNMYDWGQDGDTYYMVMEYVRGADLKSIIEQKGALPSRKVAEIGIQICSALAAAHGYDIIHRDIKPHNVMVQPDGTVKVMDFGIARAGNSTMTQTGSVLGTAHYVSPEQAQGKTLTNASDLYSLGVVLYEASTGNVPFDADSPVAVALKQVNEVAPRPSALNPEIDPGLEAIILRAMAKRVEDRYTTADEMRRDLLRVVQGQPVSAEAGHARAAAAGAYALADETSVMPTVSAYTQTPGRRPSPAPKKSPVWRWVLLTVLLIVAGLGMAWGVGLLGTQSKAIPDVTSMDRAAATTALEQDNFVVGAVGSQFDPKIAAGEVISQTPPAGTIAKKNTAVDLVISKGPDLVTVPDIVGKTQAEADAALQRAGLSGNAVSSAHDAKIPAGSVISQTPAKEVRAARGSEVTYVISLGLEQATVPDVTGLSQSTATKRLKDAGFKVKITHAASSSTPSGKVISQDKSTGAAYPKGSTVTITISTGPPLVKVPNEKGKASDVASADLTALGLNVIVTYNNVTGTNLVADQLPNAGAEVSPGATITLEIDGDKPPTLP